VRSLKTIINICLQDLRKWQRDYRILIIAILLFLLVYDNVKSYRSISLSLNEPPSIWIYPFLYTQYHQKLIFTIPLLLLFSNAPFIDNNAVYVIARCKKSDWHLGQFLYIVISSAIYYIYILLWSVILLLPFAEISTDWGRSLKTMAASSLTKDMGYNFLDIPSFTIFYFTPVQAVWFTFLLSFLMAVMLGTMIYFLNIITNTRYIGSLVGSSIIIFSCFIENFFTSSFARRFSPVTWITVDKVDVGGLTHNPSFTYCVTFFVSVSLILIAATLIFRKRIKLDIE